MLDISVVIPAYNRAATIGEAIASALAQTRQPREVIVVDDASTDGTAAIADAAGAHVIRLPENGGAARARNVGMRAASGDLIAWIDSDDYWDPDHLAIVGGLLEKYPEAAVASAGARLVGARSGAVFGYIPEGGPRDVFREAFYDWVTTVITAVVRRDVLLAVGGFDESERYAEDFDLWLRLARRHLFVASRKLTANWRWHAGQLSSGQDRQWSATYRLRRRTLDEVSGTGDHTLAGELSALFRKRWALDIQTAWDEDRHDWLRELVRLGATVPGTPRRRRWHWAVRSRIPRPLLDATRRIRSSRAPRE